MRGVAVGAVLLAAACSPATTRPPFVPLPQAAVVLFAADPPRVTTAVAEWLTAQGIPLRLVSTVDRYVETSWYRAPADSGSTATRPSPVKTRVWADPAGPGRTRLTVETVYREVEDPSRPPRDLERPAPAGSPGSRVTERLLAALKHSFEVL